LARGGTNLFKIVALSECISSHVNGGIVYVFRNTEGVFVSIWCYIFLKEKLSTLKLVGLLLLAGGVAGLGYATN